MNKLEEHWHRYKPTRGEFLSFLLSLGDYNSFFPDYKTPWGLEYLSRVGEGRLKSQAEWFICSMPNSWRYDFIQQFPSVVPPLPAPSPFRFWRGWGEVCAIRLVTKLVKADRWQSPTLH